MTRFTSLDQLAHCSPFVRAQLEQHRAALTGNPELHPAETGDKPKKRMARPEQDAGKLLVQWIDLLVLPNGLKPGQFFYHIPNGGARSAAEAGILIGQGVRPGFPDYGLALPRKGYMGLFGELKALNGGSPPAHQLEWLARLESVGFKCCVWWGFDDARKSLSQYLDIA